MEMIQSLAIGLKLKRQSVSIHELYLVVQFAYSYLYCDKIYSFDVRIFLGHTESSDNNKFCF